MRTSFIRLLVVAVAFAALISPRSTLWAITDDFDDDPRDNPDWELFEPVVGSEITADNGVFRFTFPVGIVLDHWSTINNAVQLRRTDLFDDFYIETRLRFVGSDDPAAPLWPPYNEAYQAGLIISFAAMDAFYFGPYRGTNLVVERSAQNGLCQLDPGLQEISLRIEKIGSTYAFQWRADDADPWNTVCEQTATNTPISVGLVFKSWNPALTFRETFDFDYFTLEEKQDEAPSFTVPCELGAPDRAWLGMPYIVPLVAEGFPVPTITVLQGPEDLEYDTSAKLFGGWTPGSPEEVAIEVEAENSVDSATYGWDVDVASSSILYDDPFEDDPLDFPEYWEMAALQGGIIYSLVDEDDNTWWRMEVPLVGDLGLNFDTWTTVNNAPQLRHPVAPGEDFVIETRVRIPEGTAPVATDPYLAGLMLDFDGAGDIIHWNIGGERTVNGQLSNVFMERSGFNNRINSYVSDVITGRPVDLRIQRRCDLYLFLYRADGERDWTFAGSYKTPDEPLYVGLVMKTWGGGTLWTVDFDYFDFVEPGPSALFTITPDAGPAPLEITVDASGSSSPNGNIVEYLWDFGDGSTAEGATATHTYGARGQYEVTLTVRDSQDDEGYSFRPVSVEFSSGDVSPWTSEDVSAAPPVVSGGARREGECIRILGGGTGIDGTSDGFQFVYQSLQGDGSLVAQLSEALWSTNARAGVMIRESLDPGSRHASVLCQNLSLFRNYAFVARSTTDGPSTRTTSAGSFVLPDAWVKIERVGNQLIGSSSSDGAAWTEVSRATIDLPQTALIGLAVTSRDTLAQGKEIEALFCNVTLTGGGGPTEPLFHRGDANGDGAMNITDGIFVLNYLFLGGPTPGCLEAANGNDDADINITDGIYVLNYLFLGGPTPPAPGPVDDPCGPDPVGSPSSLGCEDYPGC